MTPIFILITIVAVASAWWHESRLRERAIGLARTACRRYEVQFLDQTVSLNRRRIVRRGQGFALAHFYQFEYAIDGVDRRYGTVEFVAGRVKEVALDLVSH
ncbi:DUF3301 domain-containing protein [Granulosicoccaceae sp. 1_MG-2023]|nr:DUF3301 domain-containing protein [Granulosicoccaceae sp. 1_MG-2023]